MQAGEEPIELSTAEKARQQALDTGDTKAAADAEIQIVVALLRSQFGSAVVDGWLNEAVEFPSAEGFSNCNFLKLIISKGNDLASMYSPSVSNAALLITFLNSRRLPYQT